MAKNALIKYKIPFHDVETDAYGKPLSYRNNFAHRSAGTALNLSQDQIIEFKKCSEDINYFIENYAVIQNVGQGLGLMTPYDWQKNLFNVVKDNNRVAILSPRQSGKCCHAASGIYLRNKKNGKIRNVSIGQFYIEQKIKYLIKHYIILIKNIPSKTKSFFYSKITSLFTHKN